MPRTNRRKKKTNKMLLEEIQENLINLKDGLKITLKQLDEKIKILYEDQLKILEIITMKQAVEEVKDKNQIVKTEFYPLSKKEEKKGNSNYFS